MTKTTTYKLLLSFLTSLVSLIFAFCWITIANADNPGDLDISFGSMGIVTTSIGSIGDTGWGIAIQPDGKILVTGANWTSGSDKNIAVVRYTAAGLLDAGFGQSGIVTTSIGNGYFGYAVAVQPDGKILVVSDNTSTVAVIRYNHDGSLDDSFNGTGIVTTSLNNSDITGRSIAVQPDNKIIVAGGSNTFAVIRYLSNGLLDPAFNGTGIVTTTIGSYSYGNSVAIQPDHKIVVAGNSTYGSDFSFTIARYNGDGSLDSSFNHTGIVTTPISSEHDSADSVAIQPDGKIVVAGDIDNLGTPKIAVARYNTDGALDTNFHNSGVVTTAIGNVALTSGVGLQRNGKIVVGGSSSISGSGPNFSIVRYNNSGELDTTFNGTGVVTTSMNGISSELMALALQPDGKIVAAGFSYDFKIVLARYMGDSIKSFYLPVVFKKK